MVDERKRYEVVVVRPNVGWFGAGFRLGCGALAVPVALAILAFVVVASLSGG